MSSSIGTTATVLGGQRRAALGRLANDRAHSILEVLDLTSGENQIARGRGSERSVGDPRGQRGDHVVDHGLVAVVVHRADLLSDRKGSEGSFDGGPGIVAGGDQLNRVGLD